jgi:uncharacterized protein with ParB-like and HNH nuclease domain
MYDQRVPIAEAVENIQKEDYLLPAIQREIVWERDQITDLFDSVLQGYPIGTFLFWDIDDENRDEYKMYGFIKDYITTTKYIETQAQTRNSVVQPDGAGDLKLILDGQQRLSSFYIGLKGTYTYKQSNRWYRNEDAWKKSKLYLNITSDPDELLDADSDRQSRYEFSFLQQGQYSGRVVSRGDDLWFRAGAILNHTNKAERDELTFDIIDEHVASDADARKRHINRNIGELWDAVHEKSHITYFEEKQQNIDRVLDIFIRTNDGGTQLQKSDLLLSIATAQWDEYDAREELTSFVDQLNTKLPLTNSYDKDFVLKSSLVLAGLSVRYRVSQFNRENVAEIESQWEDIRNSIKQAATLVNHFGIDENTLTSQNSVIPIAYFFKETGLDAEDLQRGDGGYKRIKQDIKKWLLTSLLNGTFSGNSDSVLRNTREVIADAEGTTFPLAEINERIGEMNKVVGFNEEIANNVLEYEKGSKRTFLALTLLYPSNDWGSVQYHQDHIFPESQLEEEKLLERGVEPAKASEFAEQRDKLANLQLLTQRENESKQDKSFLEWFTNQEEDTQEELRERHFLPAEKEYYTIEQFDAFVDRRRELIKDHLLSLLGSPSGAGGDSGE